MNLTAPNVHKCTKAPGATVLQLIMNTNAILITEKIKKKEVKKLQSTSYLGSVQLAMQSTPTVERTVYEDNRKSVYKKYF